MVAHRVLDHPRGFGAGQPVLGLALELGLADEYREHDLAAGDHVLGRKVLGLLRPDQIGKGADGLGQRGAEALLVRAAIGGRDGVAIPAIGPVGPQRPGHRPFDPALLRARKILRPGEEFGGDAFAVAELFGEVIGEAAGELEHCFGRDLVAGERGRTLPADFDPGKQIGLRARELEQPRGFELRILAEDFGIGHEADRGAAPVGGAAELLQSAGRQSARELLREQFLVPRHLDPGEAGKRIDHRDPDPVQPAAGGVGLARKLAARMERGEDNFERRLARIFGMLVHRDAATVVGDGEPVTLIERDFYPVGMARHRLVHRVIEHFCGEVVQRAFVDPADIHTRTAAHRLEPFEHFDCGTIVTLAAACGQFIEQIIGHARSYRSARVSGASGG